MPVGIYVRTTEHREKISASKRGNTYWKGRKHKPESIQKIKDANKRTWGHRKGRPIPELQRQLVIFTTPRGEKHYEWKGTNALYESKHTWLRRNYGKASKCENPNCLGDSSRFEWANISKTYQRDRSDYIQLCKKCHANWDAGNINIPISLL